MHAMGAEPYVDVLDTKGNAPGMQVDTSDGP